MEKTHGKRGEVVTVPVHGLPPLLRAGMRVALLPPPLVGSRWHTVEAVHSRTATGSLVSLSGVGGIAEARELLGAVVLADVRELPEGYELHDADALLGREVSDEVHGVLGTIDEVMVGAANDVWVISGPHGELLVPVVDEVVPELPATGAIRVRVPAGTIAAVPAGGEGE